MLFNRLLFAELKFLFSLSPGESDSSDEEEHDDFDEEDDEEEDEEGKSLFVVYSFFNRMFISIFVILAEDAENADASLADVYNDDIEDDNDDYVPAGSSHFCPESIMLAFIANSLLSASFQNHHEAPRESMTKMIMMAKQATHHTIYTHHTQHKYIYIKKKNN